MSGGKKDIQGAHILLVDDLKDNLLMMSKIIDQFGCTCDTAQNGEEAVNIVRKKEYDFILMDLHMPGMDGLMATRLIRAWEKTNEKPRTVIIGVTGSSPGNDDEYFERIGMDDFIIKPFRIEELKDKLLSAKSKNSHSSGLFSWLRKKA